MLIDDRQLKSIHVNKVIDIARVAITNIYSDLDNIPNEFTPSEHTHKLATATNNGYISSQDFIKMNNLENFSKLKIVSGGQENTIVASAIDDTLNLVAGENVIFAYDTNSKSLIIDVDYHLDEIVGEKGDPGPAGDNGITWKPHISDTYMLTFEAETNVVTPEIPPINIRGEKGVDGIDGEDALPVAWDTLAGRPVGNEGEALFIDGNSRNVLDSSLLLLQGIYPNTVEELNAYNNDIQLKKQTYKKELTNHSNVFIYSSMSNVDTIAESSTINMTVNDNLILSYNVSDSEKDMIKGKLYSYIDDHYHKEYEQTEIGVYLPIKTAYNINKNYGAFGLCLGYIPSTAEDAGVKTLCFMIGFNRDVVDFNPYDTEYANLSLIYNFNYSGTRVLASKISPSYNLADMASQDYINDIFFRIRVTRTGNTITCEASNLVSLTSEVYDSSKYTEYCTRTPYQTGDANKIVFDLESTSEGRKFIDKCRTGIVSYNLDMYEAFYDIGDSKSLNTYPIYNLSSSVTHLNPYSNTSRNLSRNVSSIIEVGRFIKDIKTKTTYFVKGKEDIIEFSVSGSGSDKIVNNYIEGENITTELPS